MAGLAIIASDFAANAALRGYLISQVDNQLINISANSLNRLDRAGIAPAEIDKDDSPFKILAPLRGVPTATSVTLLDIDGALIGQVGGEGVADVAAGGAHGRCVHHTACDAV